MLLGPFQQPPRAHELHHEQQQQQQQLNAHRHHRHHHQNLQYSRQNPQHQRLTQQPYLATLLIALILLQHVDIFMCRHIPAGGGVVGGAAAVHSSSAAGVESKRLSISSSSLSSSSSASPNKRTLIASGGSGGGSGQLEEIFSVGDQMEANYDEYPMVVPKRAALLLDRLMVALHHALEQERRQLNDFYVNKNGIGAGVGIGIGGLKDLKLSEAAAAATAASKQEPQPDFADDNGNLPSGAASDIEQGNANNNMYSDDDPTVIMDYDFKDLNSINRATGESLMAKSFQRRANMGLDLGGEIGADGVSMLSAAAAAAAGGDDASGRNNVGAGGRMYWRCYFNAVSCF